MGKPRHKKSYNITVSMKINEDQYLYIKELAKTLKIPESTASRKIFELGIMADPLKVKSHRFT